MGKAISSWHVGVAAEALAASLFARVGLDVSVQYGANQPEYDLLVAKAELMLKVSVKGSQDGSWGLTQSYMDKQKKGDYQGAIDRWLADHNPRTIFCLVQFKDVAIDQLPRVYLATPREVADRLRATAAGRGDTILYEHKVWTSRAQAAGTVDSMPTTWKFSAQRVAQLLGSAPVVA